MVEEPELVSKFSSKLSASGRVSRELTTESMELLPSYVMDVKSFNAVFYV